MLELGFISTNRTKLAHLKYLARRVGIRIEGFRERTFHASYREPRIHDRQRLLRKSYESALQQWRRGRLSNSEFFLIEDTSVIVEALSDKREVPGVDVKFWMAETTFHRLDTQLKRRGNNRRVTVRSDMVLHLPPEVREGLQLSDPYLWVYGETHGSIIEQELSFSSNAIYPWLDNRSFNKWFVPEGERAPISCLPLASALKHDFRRKAFDGIVRFFRRLHLLPESAEPAPVQTSLFAPETIPPIFIVCGYSCAGKTTFATHLVSDHGYMHFEASDFMRLSYFERLGRAPEVNLARYATTILRREPAVVPEQILTLMDRTSNASFVLTGFRAPAEVRFLLDHYQGNAPFDLIFVDADFEIRYARAVARDRRDAPIGREEMGTKDGEQAKMGLSKMVSDLPFRVVRNETTLGDYFSACESRYAASLMLPDGVRIKPRIPFLGALEASIVHLLGSHKLGAAYYTSTEIARLATEEGLSIAQDNVSRYFNQRYSPLYEFVTSRHGRRFRLSQTGEALYHFLRKHCIWPQHSRPALTTPEPELPLRMRSMRRRLPRSGTQQ